MKEYGGYIEFERYLGKEYYQEAAALNCGRNCLLHLIAARKIKKISLPYFLCASVSKVCRKAGVEVRYYHIDEKFLPVFDFLPEEEEYLYIVNFYGQLGNVYLEKIRKQYGSIIIDNAQAFFQEPLQNADTIYVLRKYFGVADGAYLATEAAGAETYDIDISNQRMGFLLGRFEETASKYYQEYKENEDEFNEMPIRKMSALTHNLLRGIDYERVKQVRKSNFQYLQKLLGDYNLLHLREPEGPFAYPFLVEGGENLRKKLLEKKIYIPVLWPNVLNECEKNSLEYRYAQEILPLPVDQRYTVKDMEYIAENIKNNL